MVSCQSVNKLTQVSKEPMEVEVELCAPGGPGMLQTDPHHDSAGPVLSRSLPMVLLLQSLVLMALCFPSASMSQGLPLPERPPPARAERVLQPVAPQRDPPQPALRHRETF
ncbi:hypothetical protein F7725_024708 [Dissostichus mawsoni]|uniref:Uncharacterized protein n=1 Tax=Dissostichus mawsoni TaxID=36200 RepID=A0A7J5X921_DISMA|nr:hypothetical protein F7725_024708 [Dissostichus mawsoni]